MLAVALLGICTSLASAAPSRPAPPVAPAPACTCLRLSACLPAGLPASVGLPGAAPLLAFTSHPSHLNLQVHGYDDVLRMAQEDAAQQQGEAAIDK